MKTKLAYFLPLLALLSLFMGCSKKDDATPDPRDQYIGTWKEISETRNGASQPITTPDVFVITKSATVSTGMIIKINSATEVAVTLLNSGFAADNMNIPTGTYTFSDKSQAAAYTRNLTGIIASGQLTIKFIEYAESATYTHTVDDTEVFTKQ